MMRCLIPIHQEYYPERSLKRFREVCDECLLLYIVDRKVLEKVREESSYVLPSYAIEEMEEFTLNIQRREAERIANEYSAELKFVVDDYFSAIRGELLRERPDILMTDFWDRRYISVDVPVWIERGMVINKLGFFVGDVTHIMRVRRSVEMLKGIADKLHAEFCIVPGNEEVAKVLALNECKGDPDAMAVQRKYIPSFRDWKATLILV